MNQEDPYEVQEGVNSVEKPQGKVTLFWTRMLRFSIYFTVTGMTLGFIKYRLGLKLVYGDDSLDQVEAMSHGITNISTSLSMIGGFLLFGMTSVIICLIMRAKELKNLRGSQNS